MQTRSTLYDLAKRAYVAWPIALNPIAGPNQLRTWLRLRRADGSVRLHLGCGHRHLEGFVNIDMKMTGATDYVGGISKLPCPHNSVERIESYHVIEHIPHPLAPAVLREWFRVLKPGGVMVLECPDFDEGIRQYLAGDNNLLGSIYGWQRYDGDTHFYGYNPSRLSALLIETGFKDVISADPIDYHKDNEPCMRIEARK